MVLVYSGVTNRLHKKTNLCSGPVRLCSLSRGLTLADGC